MSIAQHSFDDITPVSADDLRAGIAAAHQARSETFRTIFTGLGRALMPRMSLNRHSLWRRQATPCASC